VLCAILLYIRWNRLGAPKCIAFNQLSSEL